MKTNKKTTVKPAPAAETAPAKTNTECCASEKGHRSCGCPACDHNAKRK